MHTPVPPQCSAHTGYHSGGGEERWDCPTRDGGMIRGAMLVRVPGRVYVPGHRGQVFSEYAGSGPGFAVSSRRQGCSWTGVCLCVLGPNPGQRDEPARLALRSLLQHHLVAHPEAPGPPCSTHRETSRRQIAPLI